MDEFDDVNDMVDFDQETEDRPVTSRRLYPEDVSPQVETEVVREGRYGNPGLWQLVWLGWWIAFFLTASVPALTALLVFIIVPSIYIWGNWAKVRPVTRITEYTFASPKTPCPRCSSRFVDIYSTGYFACMACGARGTYPFVTFEDRVRRLRAMCDYNPVQVKTKRIYTRSAPIVTNSDAA